MDCEEEYIKDSGKTLGDRLKEHLRPTLPICQHSHATGYPINVDCFSILGREAHGVMGTIKEAMIIHRNGPSLNWDLGTYQLPHIWDEVLLVTLSLHLRSPIATILLNGLAPNGTHMGHTQFSSYWQIWSFPQETFTAIIHHFGTSVHLTLTGDIYRK